MWYERPGNVTEKVAWPKAKEGYCWDKSCFQWTKWRPLWKSFLENQLHWSLGQKGSDILWVKCPFKEILGNLLTTQIFLLMRGPNQQPSSHKVLAATKVWKHYFHITFKKDTYWMRIIWQNSSNSFEWSVRKSSWRVLKISVQYMGADSSGRLCKSTL